MSYEFKINDCKDKNNIESYCIELTKTFIVPRTFYFEILKKEQDFIKEIDELICKEYKRINDEKNKEQELIKKEREKREYEEYMEDMTNKHYLIMNKRFPKEQVRSLVEMAERNRKEKENGRD